MKHTAEAMKEIRGKTGKVQRTVERLLAARPDLKPPLFGGAYAWSQGDIDKVVRALGGKKAGRAK